MKRCLLFLSLVLCMTLAAIAQTHRIYNIVVMNPGEPPTVITEKSKPAGGLSGFNFKENFLRDEEGKEIKFNNFLPMIGYFESKGWIFTDIEKQILSNQSNVVSGTSVFVMYKEVDEAEWLEWIENGKKQKK